MSISMTINDLNECWEKDTAVCRLCLDKVEAQDTGLWLGLCPSCHKRGLCSIQQLSNRGMISLHLEPKAREEHKTKTDEKVQKLLSEWSKPKREIED